jgi:hypothetical protein
VGRSDVPVCHVAGLGFLPGACELGKSSVVEDSRDRRIHLLPDLVKRVRGHALRVLGVFDEAQNFAHRDFVGRLGQAIAALGAAAGFDEASLLESGEDQFQKLLRDFLAACHVSDLDRLPGGLKREVEDREQGVFTFYGNVHADRANGTFYLAIVGVCGGVCKGVTWNNGVLCGPAVLRIHTIFRKYISCRFRKLMCRHPAGGRLQAATLLVARERDRMVISETRGKADSKRVAVRRKRPVKPKIETGTDAAGTGGQAQAVKSMLTKIETKMSGGDMKATLGDYIRLVQLHKELDDESPKEIKVTWVEPAETGSAKEE